MWFPQDVSSGALRSISNAMGDHCLLFFCHGTITYNWLFPLASLLPPFLLPASFGAHTCWNVPFAQKNCQ